MKVVIADPSWAGGICHDSYNLCEAMTALGVNVTLVTATRWELESLPRHFGLVKVLRHRTIIEGRSLRSKVLRRAPLLRHVLNVLDIRRAIQDSGASIVHFQGLLDPRLDPPTWRYLAQIRRGLKIIYTVHDAHPHEPGNVAEQRLAKLYETADHLFTYSHYTSDCLSSEFAVGPGRITIVPHGNMLFFRDFFGISCGEARRALGLAAHMPCVLFFGFIREYKGLDILIRAFVQVMTRIPASVLVVAGGLWTGSWADSTYSRLVNALGLQSHVKVFSDYIPLNQVSTYFAAADVVAVPYKRGTQSGVIQLSYAFEKPVVATDVGGLPEVVEDGRSGRVVPAGDTEALAAALIELLQQPAARSQMGQYGYRLAQGRHSWETIAQQILQVYQRLCE